MTAPPPGLDDGHFASRRAHDAVDASRRVASDVLIADDDPETAATLAAMLGREGYDVRTVADGEAALREVAARAPDIAILDVVMPGLSGYDVCRRLKSRASTRLTPVILVTGLDDGGSRIHGIDAGADDFLSKPFDRFELLARVRLLMRNKKYIDQLDTAEAVIVSLALTIEARDPSTLQHCQRLATYAADLGRRLGLSRDDLDALRKGGYLHDIGKVGIRDAILLKQGKLTPDEWEVMKQHTVIGDRLCGELKSLAVVRPIVRHHHELLNGDGYPDGLAGDRIPLLAQIIGVVDTFDALTHERPYRPAWSRDRAIEQLHLEVSKGWRNATLVSAFASLVDSDTTAATRDIGEPR